MHSFLVEVQTNKCWPHKCQACVLATRKLGLRAPLVARSNLEVYTVTNTYQPIGGVAKCRLFSQVSICVHLCLFFPACYHSKVIPTKIAIRRSVLFI